MLVAFTGSQGSGKSLSMAVLGTALASGSGVALYSNYPVSGSLPVNSIEELMKLKNCVVLLDELWLTMDSRMWKDNVLLTSWIFQCRKRGMVVFYSTQHMDQIDLRVRNATDYRIACEIAPRGLWLSVIDHHYRIIHRKYLIDDPSRFYGLFDTYAVLKSLV